MKYTKTLAVFIIFNFQFLIINSQVPDQSVTVTRDYQPTIQDAGKIQSVPAVKENGQEKLAATYEDGIFPLPVGQNIQMLSAAKALPMLPEKPNDAYIRLGLGNYWNNLLDFALPIVKKPDLNIDLKGNHLAAFGKKIHSNSRASLNIDKMFNNFTIFGGATGGYEYFNYYGDFYKSDSIATAIPAADSSVNSFFANDRQRLSRVGIFAGVRSLPDAEGWRYSGTFKYSNLNAAYGANEKNFEVPFALSWVRRDNYRVGFDAKFQYLNYTAKDSLIAHQFTSYAIFSVAPYFIIERESWNAKIGITTAFDFSGTTPVSIAPDANIEFKAFPGFLSLYAAAGGGLKVNSLNEIYQENRYLLPNLKIKDTYTPFDICAGFKLKPFAGLLVDAYADYRYIYNQYFYRNDVNSMQNKPVYVNRFTVDYSDASLLKVGARLNYDYRNVFNLQAKIAYNQWKVYMPENTHLIKAWQMPKIETDASLSVRITEDLNISASAFYIGERQVLIGTEIHQLKPIIDVNFGASYSYLNWLSFFVKANNLLNSEYQIFNGYSEQRLNILLGAAVSF